jgi:acyl-coenzyme A thioesterase PaaI-like protein
VRYRGLPKKSGRGRTSAMSSGRRIGTAEGRITDRNGRLLAHGTTTCLIFPSV